MNRQTSQVVEEVLAMPPAERAAVAEKAIASLDPLDDGDVEAAWQAECARRLSQIEAGQVELEPWEAVRDRIRGRLRASG